MKVLAVIDSLSLGGAERLLATLARAGPSAGFDLEVVSLTEPAGVVGMASVLESEGVRPRRLGLNGLGDPRAIPRIARAVRDSGCDVVHAHLDYAAALATPAARLVGRHTVCTFHNVPSPLPPREAVKERISVFAASHSAAFVFVSDASLGGFAARYRPRPNWLVLRNGIDLGQFRPMRRRWPDDIPIPDGAPTAILVGRLHRLKGQLQTIRIWPRVVEVLPDAHLLLVGGGDFETALRDAATGHGVADRVVFAGVRDDVPALMQAAAVVLLPSEKDALPTMLIEAGAVAKPVVATVIGGIPEIVEHGKTGLLVMPGDDDALVSAITRLLTDTSLASEMGARARERMEAHFDMHDWARRLHSVYSAAVRGQRITRATIDPHTRVQTEDRDQSR